MSPVEILKFHGLLDISVGRCCHTCPGSEGDAKALQFSRSFLWAVLPHEWKSYWQAISNKHHEGCSTVRREPPHISAPAVTFSWPGSHRSIWLAAALSGPCNSGACCTDLGSWRSALCLVAFSERAGAPHLRLCSLWLARQCPAEGARGVAGPPGVPMGQPLPSICSEEMPFP